uniref:Uncharacterized protein n=1 Tax=Noccaea caerulescens TaxID=107243 RepID=A0A1J3ERU4_NOCCA
MFYQTLCRTFTQLVSLDFWEMERNELSASKSSMNRSLVKPYDNTPTQILKGGLYSGLPCRPKKLTLTLPIIPLSLQKQEKKSKFVFF